MKTVFAAHTFTNIDSLPFAAKDYSYLKFGSDRVARAFGHDLATRFFDEHAPALMQQQCVVIPSPYNFVPNAATIMSHHFLDKLNRLLVEANGQHMEWSLIHRKTTYTSDYGFLTKEQRVKLLSGDRFFANTGFYDGKTLIFVDDIKITGTHEMKLEQMMFNHKLDNPTFFVYYAKYAYNGLGAEIEAELNLSGVKNIADYLELSQELNHHIIVRPIKFLLASQPHEFDQFLNTMSKVKLVKLYHACLGEGYYMIPHYQRNFQKLADSTLGYL